MGNYVVIIATGGSSSESIVHHEFRKGIEQ
jgi:hypothetical protein